MKYLYVKFFEFFHINNEKINMVLSIKKTDISSDQLRDILYSTKEYIKAFHDSRLYLLFTFLLFIVTIPLILINLNLIIIPFFLSIVTVSRYIFFKNAKLDTESNISIFFVNLKTCDQKLYKTIFRTIKTHKLINNMGKIIDGTKAQDNIKI